MKLVLLLASIFLCFGCATGQVVLSDVDYPLLDIQKGVQAILPSGTGGVSANGRSFSSRYFDPNKTDGKRDLKSSSRRERATAKATILGDRRPYSIEIEVFVEEDISGKKPEKGDDFIEGEFVAAGKDIRLANYFKERLANYLARLERKKNIIDDFRPF